MEAAQEGVEVKEGEKNPDVGAKEGEEDAGVVQPEPAVLGGLTGQGEQE